MKTTIEIADALLEEAKAKAARENTTLRALVEEGLRHILHKEPPSKPFKLRDASFKGGTGLHPDVAHLTMGEIIHRSYGARGGFPEWE